ncbi:hypothetical protein E3P99_02203 [Wallemia hederae]|uniref:Peptidase M20 dimerisation domain-containing protein n=1 Tax=Wallemia hederae TaxID=1540922 RepID=A0A4T0FL39_9BASI|nr:hypothetical protein E3P99_02203 [Wallemia hederae]
MDEKQLPQPVAGAGVGSTAPASQRSWKRPLAAAAILCCYMLSRCTLLMEKDEHVAMRSPVQCPAQPPSLPSASIPFVEPHGHVERWSRSVTYPTISYDDFGSPGNDTRYDTFPPFYAYLRNTFPAVHATLAHETVNGYGNLYTWAGSDDKLKPLILMAHNDVVPVPAETVGRWEYAPFSGHVDEQGWVHGRGAGDCKNLLLSVYEVVESLIHAGFKPRRSVILAFGFDEEISGPQGAKHIAARLLEKYGKDSAIAILDEGGVMDLGLGKEDGVAFALPAVKEKGYFDVKVSVETAGGHSSIPQPHTSIGYLAKLIERIEAHPHSPHLALENPVTAHLQCLVEHAPHSLDKPLLHRLQDASRWDEAAEMIAERDVAQRYLFQTSQAVDLIQGGVKVNALPEVASAVVNQRIDVASSVAEMKQHLNALIRPYAERLGMRFVGFDEEEKEDASQHAASDIKGTVKLELFGSPLDPAPSTPTEGQVWDTLAGTLKGLFGDHLIVSPHLMTGNTDTRHYWDLTNNIYRFEAHDASLVRDIHTVNERVHKDAHVQTMSFLHQFIQQLDNLNE